jgi:hypothetical protein
MAFKQTYEESLYQMSDRPNLVKNLLPNLPTLHQLLNLPINPLNLRRWIPPPVPFNRPSSA